MVRPLNAAAPVLCPEISPAPDATSFVLCPCPCPCPCFRTRGFENGCVETCPFPFPDPSPCLSSSFFPSNDPSNGLLIDHAPCPCPDTSDPTSTWIHSATSTSTSSSFLSTLTSTSTSTSPSPLPPASLALLSLPFPPVAPPWSPQQQQPRASFPSASPSLPPSSSHTLSDDSPPPLATADSAPVDPPTSLLRHSPGSDTVQTFPRL